MEKDKTIQQNQATEVDSHQENVFSSGFDGKGAASLPPPPLSLSASGNGASQLKEAPTDSNVLIRETNEGPRRVDMNRNSDNRAYNRWDNKGQDSSYSATFLEKFKEQSIAFFGSEMTHEEILVKISTVEKEGKSNEAEALRKKLFTANQYAIVETLDSPSNSIYEKTNTSTYCNIYAYDVVTALGGYLPRLWWTPEIAAKIKSGELKDDEITVKYGAGVTQEMNANQLNEWMLSDGKEFGWEMAANMKTAQEAANEGNIVIILASNKNAGKSGHVNVILPESEQHKSLQHTDGTTLPLQSQAGGTNFKYDTYTKETTGADSPKWWENSNHEKGAAWIFMGKIQSPILTPEQVGIAPSISKDKISESKETSPKVVTNDSDPAKEKPKTQEQAANTNAAANTTPNSENPKAGVDAINQDSNPTIAPDEKKNSGVQVNAKPKDPNILHLSSGIMMLATEGAFDGGDNDVRKPHFPENLAFYRKITKEDEAAWAKLAASKRPQRYSMRSGATDSVKADKDGDLVRSKLLNRHKPQDYDLTPSSGETLATGPNNSGLTIGMGFDLGARFGSGDKAKAQKELMAAGFMEATAERLSDAVGLRGTKAGKLAGQLRKSGMSITAKQVLDLLSKTRKSYYQNFTEGIVHPSIEEVLVKINYWKGGTGGKSEVQEIFNAAKEKQGAGQFDAAIEVMQKYSGKTYETGIKFLTIIRNHISSGGTVEFEEGAGTVESLTDGSNDTFRVIKEATKTEKSKGKDLQQQLSGTALPESSGLDASSTTAKGGQKPQADGRHIKQEKENPAQAIVAKYESFLAGTIGMPDLARAVKPYAATHGKSICYLMDQLGWSEQDNFAYSLASNSSNGELLSFETGLLKRMSEALDTWLTTRFSENETQKARVDAARAGIALEKLKKFVPQKPNEKASGKAEIPGEEKMIFGPLLDPKDWISQANPADYPKLPTLKKEELKASSYDKACYDCCAAMLKRTGFPVGGNILTTLKDVKADGSTTVPEGSHEKGLQIIDTMLAKGIPVIAGVDKGANNIKFHGHKQGNTAANSGRATDHWVVIHGKGIDAAGKTFYVFFDPGRYSIPFGTSTKENRLVVDNTIKRSTDTETYNNYSYVLSDVRY